MAIKVAVLSDIHGNSWALQTVLADIKNKHITTIVNLGDSLYGPLDPVGTFQILIQENIISILGNEDRILIENRTNDCRDQTREFVLNQLDSDALAWLKNQKKTLTLGDLFLCHGTPSSDTTYLMHKVLQGKLITKENDEIEKDLEKVDGKIVLCGHSHIPKILSTCSGKLVINPGSVEAIQGPGRACGRWPTMPFSGVSWKRDRSEAST